MVSEEEKRIKSRERSEVKGEIGGTGEQGRNQPIRNEKQIDNLRRSKG